MDKKEIHSDTRTLVNETINLDPFRYQLYHIFVLCFCLGLVAIVCLDWLIHYGLLDPYFNRYIRGFLLCLFLLCLLDPGTWNRGRRFPLLQPFVVLGFLITVYALYKRDLANELYYVIRILFWILGTIFVYRMLLFKMLSKKLLMRTINIITLIYFVMVLFSMLNTSCQFSQNISIYVLLWCFPFLMIQDKSSIRSILIIFVYLAIPLAFKRGAMLALVFSSVAYLICSFLMNRTIKSGFKTFSLFIALTLVIILSISVVAKVRSDFFARRVADLDNMQEIGSGRGTFYSVVLDHHLEALNFAPINFFFGFGSRSAQKTICTYYGLPYQEGAYAHSDWLQLLHDYGLIGLFVMTWFHISIVKLILKGYQNKNPYVPSLVMAYVIFFMMNIYSGIFFFPNAIYFGTFFALVSLSIQNQPGSPANSNREKDYYSTLAIFNSTSSI